MRCLVAAALALSLCGVGCTPSWRAQTGASRDQYRAVREGCRWEARYRRQQSHPDSVYRWCLDEIARVASESGADADSLEGCLVGNRELVVSFEACMESAGWERDSRGREPWSRGDGARQELRPQIERCSPRSGPGALESYTDAVTSCLSRSSSSGLPAVHTGEPEGTSLP